MLCIAAFIIFALLGIFSATHRKLAGDAWYCVSRKITFRPCDISFGEELRSQILGKFVIKYPKFAQVLDKTLDPLAFLFVILSIWSTISVALAGLNLWIYDSCDPLASESCSLGGEACGIDSNSLNLERALAEGKIGQWLAQPFFTFTDTLGRIPDKFKTWKAEDFLPENHTFYQPFSAERPIALEVLDPGCTYCKKQFLEIKKASFEQKYNLTYLAYPIFSQGKYKFTHSKTIVSYLEAIRQLQSQKQLSTTNLDWKILERIFTDTAENGLNMQDHLNNFVQPDQIEPLLQSWLKAEGLSDTEINLIVTTAHTPAIKTIIQNNQIIVENQIKTIKIPTIIFNNQRYDRLIEVNKLK